MAYSKIPDIDQIPLTEFDQEFAGNLDFDLQDCPEKRTTENAKQEYPLFVLLGVGIIWTWNTLAGATPYFRRCFESQRWMKSHHEAAIFVSFSIPALGTVTYLTTKPDGARYDRRSIASMVIAIIVCGSLTLSTFLQPYISDSVFLTLLLSMAACVGVANALSQNGVFALVAGLGQPRLVQGVLLGSAVAGMLIPVSEIIIFHTTVNISLDEESLWPKLFFLLAFVLSLVTLANFKYIVRQARQRYPNTGGSSVSGLRKNARIDLRSLQTALWDGNDRFLAAAMFLCLATTALCPVYASRVRPILPDRLARLIKDHTTFTAFSFLIWNIGDFGGTMMTLLDFHVLHSPSFIAAAAILKLFMIPLFSLCNIDGQGAVVNSDFFYLIVLQGAAGLLNGWITGACLMAASRSNDQAEREIRGAVMVFFLMMGLTVGSMVGLILD